MWTEDKLDALLSQPSEALIEDIKALSGDIILLGAGGKVGPNLALMAKRAVQAADVKKRVIAVSRFSDPIARGLLENNGIETISADLLEEGALEKLPDAENVVYLAGRKFGTGDSACLTWAMNAALPTLVSRRYKGARIVAFSTGNVYPFMPVASGGADESVAPSPIGEYAMSSLARERVFEYAAREYGSRVLLLRLNYAVDLRYGVLYDLAKRMLAGETISLEQGCFNCVWQGYVNEVTLRALLLAESPAKVLNITGPETVSVRYACEQLGKALGVTPTFSGVEKPEALLSNAAACFSHFGYPTVSLSELIKWQAQWIQDGGRTLNKPTHFEERKGNF